MNLGTSGFVGGRLRQARNARGISATAMADLMNITSASISLYERGESSPQVELLARIADTLDLPMSFFTLPIRTEKTKPVFFRSHLRSIVTKMDLKRCDSMVEWLGDIILPYLRQYISFPAVNLPPNIVVDNARDLSGNDIENIATAVRNHWGVGIGPIRNVLLLLESNGIPTILMDLKIAEMNSFSNVYNGVPLIFLSAVEDTATKLRAYALRELGHFILHSNVTQAQLNDPQFLKLTAEQADHFAGAFLVPSDSFMSEYIHPSLNVFFTMKSKWLTPIGLLIKRVGHLKIATKDEEKKLWLGYCRKGWRRKEPLEERITIEKPILLNSAIDLIIKEGIKSIDQITYDIPLSNKDIEELLNLPPGYLAPLSSLVKLNDRSSTAVEDGYRDAILQAAKIKSH